MAEKIKVMLKNNQELSGEGSVREDDKIIEMYIPGMIRYIPFDSLLYYEVEGNPEADEGE